MHSKTYNFDEIIDRKNTASVKVDLLEKLFGNPDLLSFWVADMDFRTPDFIVEAIRKRTEHELFGYPFKTDRFYSSIQGWLKRRHKWNIDAGWISFSPGVVPAINLCIMAFSNPGDKIIIQPPVYFPFFSAVKNHKRELVMNELKFTNGHYSFDLEDLELKAKQGAKLLIFSHPHNPVGRAWDKEELKALTDICLKYHILILSDEIHSDLMLDGREHLPLASLDDTVSKQVITLMAPSKTFNLAGLASSFLVISDPGLRSTYEEVLERIHVGMGNTFGLLALETAYESGDEWLRQLLNYLDQNLACLLAFFNMHIPSVKPIIPQATYLVWLDFRKTGMKGPELKKFLSEKAGIALNEGSTFGPGGEGFMRMNIACPREILSQGMLKLAEALRNLGASG